MQKKQAPDGWYVAIRRAWLAGVLTYAELCWLIKTRGSSTQ